MKPLKDGPQKLLIIGPNLFFRSPAQPTAHSLELIFHIINMSQYASVLLSVAATLGWRSTAKASRAIQRPSNFVRMCNGAKDVLNSQQHESESLYKN